MVEAVAGTAVLAVKESGWRGVKVIGVSWPTTPADIGIVIASTFDWAAAADETKLCGWMDGVIVMDGCDKSRLPRRSTLLAAAVLAVDTAATGDSEGVCIGGTDGTAVDWNGWKLPLGLQRPHNCTPTNSVTTDTQQKQTLFACIWAWQVQQRNAYKICSVKNCSQQKPRSITIIQTEPWMLRTQQNTKQINHQTQVNSLFIDIFTYFSNVRPKYVYHQVTTSTSNLRSMCTLYENIIWICYMFTRTYHCIMQPSFIAYSKTLL